MNTLDCFVRRSVKLSIVIQVSLCFVCCVSCLCIVLWSILVFSRGPDTRHPPDNPPDSIRYVVWKNTNSSSEKTFCGSNLLRFLQLSIAASICFGYIFRLADWVLKMFISLVWCQNDVLMFGSNEKCTSSFFLSPFGQPEPFRSILFVHISMWIWLNWINYLLFAWNVLKLKYWVPGDGTIIFSILWK